MLGTWQLASRDRSLTERSPGREELDDAQPLGIGKRAADGRVALAIDLAGDRRLRRRGEADSRDGVVIARMFSSVAQSRNWSRSSDRDESRPWRKRCSAGHGAEPLPRDVPGRGRRDDDHLRLSLRIDDAEVVPARNPQPCLGGSLLGPEVHDDACAIRRPDRLPAVEMGLVQDVQVCAIGSREGGPNAAAPGPGDPRRPTVRRATRSPSSCRCRRPRSSTRPARQPGRPRCRRCCRTGCRPRAPRSTSCRGTKAASRRRTGLESATGLTSRTFEPSASITYRPRLAGSFGSTGAVVALPPLKAIDRPSGDHAGSLAGSRGVSDLGGTGTVGLGDEDPRCAALDQARSRSAACRRVTNPAG